MAIVQACRDSAAARLPARAGRGRAANPPRTFMASNGPAPSKGGLWGRLFGVQHEQPTKPAPQDAAASAAAPEPTPAAEPEPTPAPAPPSLSLDEASVLTAAPPAPEPAADAAALEPATEDFA